MHIGGSVAVQAEAVEEEVAWPVRAGKSVESPRRRVSGAVSNPGVSVRLDRPVLWRAAVEGEERPDVVADVGGGPKPGCEGSAMAAAAGRHLVVP